MKRMLSWNKDKWEINIILAQFSNINYSHLYKSEGDLVTNFAMLNSFFYLVSLALLLSGNRIDHKD